MKEDMAGRYAAMKHSGARVGGHLGLSFCVVVNQKQAKTGQPACDRVATDRITRGENASPRPAPHIPPSRCVFAQTED